MPTDRLGQPPTTPANGSGEHVGLDDTERAVLTVLTGTCLTDAADTVTIQPAELADAVDVYQQAGRHALEQQMAPTWWQLYIQFADWEHAEQTFAEHIAPVLDRAESAGHVAAWWFMRKHPCWRLRVRPGSAGLETKSCLTGAFDELVADGHIAAWWPGIYEAETSAFGGETGMELVHDLFCVDSRAVVNLLQDNRLGLGRRELSLLLCSLLMRAAGLEWYEQGDVSHRIIQERHLPDEAPTTKLSALANDVTPLLRADTSPNGALLTDNGPLEPVADWVAAVRRTGKALGDASRDGTLQRGLRDVLAYVVIFHWNRLGLTARTQNILARAAHHAILRQPMPPTATHLNGQPDSLPPQARPIGSTSDTADQVLVRLPLIWQGRRSCADLPTRIREVREFAHSCHQPIEAEDRIDRACSAWNLAALIAADCNMPALAAEMCTRQFHLLRQAWPVSGRTAITAIQPLINLARLTKRSGNPEAAYHEFAALNRATHHGGTAVIHDLSVTLDGLTIHDSNNLPTASRYLHRLLREDGTRALAATGNWDSAARHAAQYDDATEQLREARQTRIIAHILNGHTESACTLLDTSTRTHPWEHAVEACLRSYAHLKTGKLTQSHVAAMLAAVARARQSSERSASLFHTRLSLTAVDLAAEVMPEATNLLSTELADEANRSADAVVAREVLNHPLCRDRMTSARTTALTALVDGAGLDSGTLPQTLLAELTSSLQTAGTVLAQTLEVDGTSVDWNDWAECATTGKLA